MGCYRLPAHMDLTLLHGYVLGYAIIASWVVVGVWSLVLRVAGSEETPNFWRAVSVAQVLLAAQLLFGIVLLLMGRWPGPADAGMGDLAFHLSYGILSPLVVLVFAHAWARSGRFNPYSIFAVVGLVNFGLTFRAWQVGIFGG